MTQRLLAELLDVNERQVRRWVCGDTPVPKMAFMALEYIRLTGQNVP